MSKKIESLLRFVADFHSFHALQNSSNQPAQLHRQEELSADELDLIAAARQDSSLNCVKSAKTKSKL